MGKLSDKIKAKVAAKTAGIKGKVKGKVAAKCGKACAAFALLAALTGCHMGEQPTAQRQQTSTITDNKIDIRVIAPTNAVYDSEGNPVAAVRIEIGNLAQANETSGTETQTASPSNTPTVSTPVQIDARYNDAMSAVASGAAAVKGVAEAAKGDGGSAAVPASLKTAISQYFVSRGGDVGKAKMYYDANGVLTMSDGTTTVECAPDGQCRECGDK